MLFCDNAPIHHTRYLGFVPTQIDNLVNSNPESMNRVRALVSPMQAGNLFVHEIDLCDMVALKATMMAVAQVSQSPIMLSPNVSVGNRDPPPPRLVSDPSPFDCWPLPFAPRWGGGGTDKKDRRMRALCGSQGGRGVDQAAAAVPPEQRGRNTQPAPGPREARVPPDHLFELGHRVWLCRGDARHRGDPHWVSARTQSLSARTLLMFFRPSHAAHHPDRLLEVSLPG